ncbi:MAG: TonB-dependent receptor [Bacteroidales bacterium]|nr:TonB-dependent receptor [Candidatus Sodaliphilus fimicaballi]
MKQETFKIPARLLALVMGLLLSIGAYAQITVNGIVKDATGEPVIGASVRVVGTQTGTVTDFDGNFTLNNVKQGAKLQVTSIGYQAQEVAAAPQLEIVMNDDSQVLENLVVIGYGVVKKSDVTGSVTALKPDSKNKGVTVSAQDMLAGKVPGMSVTSGGGTPGGAATIRIRGGSSLNASNDPLIVVDGVPLDNGGVKGFPNGLGMINPNDIESFNVLKDASAAAIYGSRGSNGVIIITTKKGKRGQKPSVAYNGSFTVNTHRKSLELMDGDEYRAFVKQLYAGNAREEEALAALGTANTDWQKEIYRTAYSHDHNVQVSGSAGSVLPYRLSLGYTNDQGILKTSSFERYTVAANLNPSLFKDHLVMNLNAKFMYGKNRYADGGAIGNAVRFDPTQPVKANGFDNFGGYFEWLTSNSALGDANWPMITNTNAPRNPVAILEGKDDRAKSHAFTGSADIDYKVHGFEDLRLHLTLGGDFTGGKQTTSVAPWSPNACYWGSEGWSNQSKENRTLSTYAQYYKDFNDAHHFDIMAGYEWQHFWRKENSEYVNHYPTNSALPQAGEVHTTTLQNNGLGFRTESYLVSFFGRMNYIFNQKLYLTFTMRADGSSRFNWLNGQNNQWGYFPSAALAYNIKKEDFLKDVDALSDLKIRLGYGLTGQQDGVGDYGYFANYSMSTGVNGSFYDLVGDGTLARPNAYNPNLKWETTATANVGIDFGFLNNRITGNLDVYQKKTTDLINYAAVAAMSNFRNQVNQNIGSLKNTGFEFAINYKAIATDDVALTLGYNFNWQNNKITELIDDDPDYYVPTGGISSGTGVQCQAHHVGYPKSSYYVYQQVYDKNGKPLEGVFVDRNGDGVISDKDKYFYKSPDAPVAMGFNARLDYKNFDFGFNMRANIGNYVFNDTECGFRNVGPNSILESVSGNYLNNRLKSALDYGWTTYDTYSTLSDRWVQNASFLKMDNITLGYSFSGLAKTSSYSGIGGRVYATVNNVFCITKYKGIDPEVFGGIDNNLYPRPFSFLVGLSLNF